MTATDRVDDIRARLAAATPGPWVWGVDYDRSEDEVQLCFQSEVDGEVIDATDIFVPEHVELLALEGVTATLWVDESPNAELIAAAPADLAWLLEQVSELRARLYDSQREGTYQNPFVAAPTWARSMG